jgi:hypothetical protein
MSAVSVLRFLTANIVDATKKEYLRKPLANSLEATGDYDPTTVERALDRFFGTGLQAVK